MIELDDLPHAPNGDPQDCVRCGEPDCGGWCSDCDEGEPQE
jgi:hypothetical protein